MLIETLLAMRDLPRLHEIASVLVRHGFGDLVRRTGVVGALERAGQALHRGSREPTAALTPAQRARHALAELGPSFVKLGQLLATRVDLFPPDWIAEFERLQSDVPPVPFETLLPALEQALGRSPFEVFRELDRTPLGAASIAQVHGAILQDGSAVVVKVVRPGIRPKIDADLRIVGLPGRSAGERDPRGQTLPAGADGRRVRALHAARARPRAGGARPGALRPQLRGRSRRPGAARLLGVHPRVDERPGARPGHSRTRSRRGGRRRAGPPRPGPARRRRGAQDDPGGRLLPRRPPSGQRVLPARTTASR